MYTIYFYNTIPESSYFFIQLEFFHYIKNMWSETESDSSRDKKVHKCLRNDSGSDIFVNCIRMKLLHKCTKISI